MKTMLYFGVAAALALVATGCMSVDYVGQSFGTTPDDIVVQVFGERASYPTDQYRIIGRAELRAPDGTSAVDMREKMAEIAREHGGDAIKVAGYEKALVADHYQQPEERAELRRGPNPAANAYSGAFGTPVNDEEAQWNRREHMFKLLVLMNNERFEAFMAERRAKRTQDAIVTAPATESTESTESTATE